MILLLTLLFPGVLLVLMLSMERVEKPLRDQAVGEQITIFLESARPDEVETFVVQGLSNVLDRYWSRRRATSRGRLRSKLVGRPLARG